MLPGGPAPARTRSLQIRQQTARLAIPDTRQNQLASSPRSAPPWLGPNTAPNVRSRIALLIQAAQQLPLGRLARFRVRLRLLRFQMRHHDCGERVLTRLQLRSACPIVQQLHRREAQADFATPQLVAEARWPPARPLIAQHRQACPEAPPELIEGLVEGLATRRRKRSYSR